MSKKYSTSKLFVYALLAGIPVSYAQIVINKPIEPKSPAVQQEQNTGFLWHLLMKVTVIRIIKMLMMNSNILFCKIIQRR